MRVSERALLPITTMAGLLEVQAARPSLWLRRYLADVERRTGNTVMVRSGQGEKRATYRVSMAAIRRHAPELLDTRDDAARAASSLVRMVLKRFDEVEEKLDEIETRMNALATRR